MRIYRQGSERYLHCLGNLAGGSCDTWLKAMGRLYISIVTFYTSVSRLQNIFPARILRV